MHGECKTDFGLHRTRYGDYYGMGKLVSPYLRDRTSPTAHRGVKRDLDIPMPGAAPRPPTDTKVMVGVPIPPPRDPGAGGRLDRPLQKTIFWIDLRSVPDRFSIVLRSPLDRLSIRLRIPRRRAGRFSCRFLAVGAVAGANPPEPMNRGWAGGHIDYPYSHGGPVPIPPSL